MDQRDLCNVFCLSKKCICIFDRSHRGAHSWDLDGDQGAAEHEHDEALAHFVSGASHDLGGA